MLYRTKLLFISLISAQLNYAANESPKPNDQELVALAKAIHEKDSIFTYDARIIQTGYLTRQTDTPNTQKHHKQSFKSPSDHCSQEKKS